MQIIHASKKVLIFCFAVLLLLSSKTIRGFSFDSNSEIEKAVAIHSDALTEEDLEIVKDQAILCGSSKQMQLTNETNGLFNNVQWSSSDESVISCTKNGVITGKAKGSALITVKATFGSASRSILVYCAERYSRTYTVETANPFFLLIDHTPSLFDIKQPYFNLGGILRSIFRGGRIIPFQVDVLGYYNSSYYYVRFKSNSEKIVDGFVHSSFLPNNIGSAEEFKELSRYAIDIWEGVNSESYVVTTNYQGTVTWKSSDTEIFTYNSATHQLYGKKPGVAKLTASANGKTLTCHVRVLYHWPKEWIGAALRKSSFWVNSRNGLIEYDSIPEGAKFKVYGDMGNRDGWAYGSYQPANRSEPYWGYVQIGDISTKNTVSFYNSLGWRYPLQNTAYNYLYSPYSPRVLDGDRSDHRGFDIPTSKVKSQANISGQPIVAPFDGVVKLVGSDQNKQHGGGFYACITSNTVDPVTNKNIIVIIQHMNALSPLRDGQSVKKGETIVGYVGESGNAQGPHLHFEANNWNAAYGESGRSDFTHTINPIFFYMQFPFDKNNDCYATNHGYGHYWYNYDN